MREILTNWTMASGGGKVSVMYFDDTLAVTDQRAAIGTLFGAVDAFLDTSVSWVVDTSGREINAATGALTGSWGDGTPRSGSGASSGQSVPDAAQVLLQWHTDDIVNGRFIRGRTFVPGLSTLFVTDGNLGAAQLTTIATAANAFDNDPLAGFGIWHRPVLGAGGSFHSATASDVWAEFAVLRRRRG